jgi:1-deoxy-D-xylulose-5-phosphate synthase
MVRYFGKITHLIFCGYVIFQMEHFPLLDQVNSPLDLKDLNHAELSQLSEEIRTFLIDSVTKTGGHLAAGLGVVELTLAIHKIFDTPKDKLIWDVGHQSYPHKMITGRKDQMHTMRKKGGLSGFNNPKESEYDTFGVGHSSTSISAALGMAIAAQKKGLDTDTIAVIGDGAMTAGMAFEALNDSGARDANILVILNDNDMSISGNVGALNRYLTKLWSSKLYSSARERSEKILSIIPSIWELAKRTEEHVKGMIVPGTLFEELGYQYYGPVDGHDLPNLLTILSNLKRLKGPRILHVITKKGKGYEPAESDPCKFHGIPPKSTGTAPVYKGPSYTDTFSQWICDMAEQDENLIAITPAMCEGSGLVDFKAQFPERFIDVGIAEQHSVTLAAGLACEDQKPVVAIYSTFLQRAYDQLIHDVALQNLPVVFAIDRAGLVGPDGATHAGNFDLSFLRCIPNMLIMAPANQNECRKMLSTAYAYNGPSAVRYPRGKGISETIDSDLNVFEQYHAVTIKEGTSIAILAFGSMVQPALSAAETLNATVINMRFIKPLDTQSIIDAAKKHDLIVTIEENVIAGGAGSGINEVLAHNQLCNKILNLGLPDQFIEHGTQEELLKELKLDAKGITECITAFTSKKHK